MKAYILGQNSNEKFFENESDINYLNNNYLKKNKGISKSCKEFPENDFIKLKNENEYANKLKKISTNRNMKNNVNKNSKWQRELKNRIYNNYYNKDIRKKYTNMNSEDSSINAKENKVKYMDWTENNSIQGNTLSVKSHQLSNSNYSNYNLKKKFNNPKNNNFIQENDIQNEINYNNNDDKNDDEEIININCMDESDRTKSSKGQKIKLDKEENSFINNNINNKHILFEIKLTKEEYKMLLKQKTKGNKKSK